MRLIVLVAAALAVGVVSAADAAPAKKRVVAVRGAVQPLGPGSTYVMHRDEQGRTRTKILVQKRSYLDGGTEVMPGGLQTQQTNFIDMNQRPEAAFSNNNIPLHPIPDPFYLPGKNNPYFR